MILRQYIRAVLKESWHDHLNMVMLPGNGFDEDKKEEEEDEEQKKEKPTYPKNNRNPMDPYGGSFEGRGTRPNALATSRAYAHTGGVGFGSGPMSGRFPGGMNQGF